MKLPLRSFVAAAALCAAAAPASAQVQAWVASGSLYVVGSPAADALSLWAADGTVRVNGLSGTLVNDAASQTFQGVSNVISISMGAGDDTLLMTDCRPRTHVRVHLGDGDDVFFASRNEIRGDFVIDAGAAGANGDLVALAGSDLVGNVVVRTLAIQGEKMTLGLRGQVVGRDVRVACGAGADELYIDGNTVVGSLAVDTGRGADRIEFASTAISPGNYIGGALSLDSGADDDVLRFGSPTSGISTIVGRAGVRTGLGADTVTLRHIVFESPVRFRGGSQFDAIELHQSVFGNEFRAGALLNDFESIQ